QANTNPDHMPDKHKQFINFNREYVLDWADSAGMHILTTVRSILSSYKTEKQGLKSCLGLMKLADKHSIERLENACERALTYTPRPTLKSIQMILKTGQDKLPTNESSDTEEKTGSSFGFTRGAAYYGGERK
ncbi:IS21 family transposase, partial [Siminovitchia sediminis]